MAILTYDEALSLAWTYCAPNRLQSQFPRGFWPDVARVAIAMFDQQTEHPNLDFTPTRCARGSYPEPRQTNKKIPGLDLSKLEINI